MKPSPYLFTCALVFAAAIVFGASCSAPKRTISDKEPQTQKASWTDLDAVFKHQHKYSGSSVTVMGYLLENPEGWYFTPSARLDWEKSSEIALVWNGKTKQDLAKFKKVAGGKVVMQARYQAYTGPLLDMPSPQGGMFFDVSFPCSEPP